jgi:hypothetical protein
MAVLNMPILRKFFSSHRLALVKLHAHQVSLPHYLVGLLAHVRAASLDVILFGGCFEQQLDFGIDLGQIRGGLKLERPAKGLSHFVVLQSLLVKNLHLH